MRVSSKLYANNRCIAECDESMTITQNGTYSPSQEDGYNSVTINTEQEIKKQSCNCPNCGAPISGYICEYCGTEVKHYEPTEDLDDLIRQRRLAEIQASQEFQTRCLLKDKEKPDISISKADEEFVSTIFVFMIGMVLFTIFAIVVTIIYNIF